MADHIFISYRRSDAPYATGTINDRLRQEFGEESIFTDVDNIPLGVDFRAHLDQKVSQCSILLAVIGQDWLSAKNDQGELRLQDPADFVRLEIESALERDILVIPLLVDNVTVPSAGDLPESLKDLPFRNGTSIRPPPDIHTDIDRLIKSLKRHLQSLEKEAVAKKRQHADAEAKRRTEEKEQRQAKAAARRNAKEEAQRREQELKEKQARAHAAKEAQALRNQAAREEANGKTERPGPGRSA